MNATPEFEVVTTHSHSVICDGGNPAVGHPQVYLQIKPEVGEITCPYCSRTFRYAPLAQVS